MQLKRGKTRPASLSIWLIFCGSLCLAQKEKCWPENQSIGLVGFLFAHEETKSPSHPSSLMAEHPVHAQGQPLKSRRGSQGIFRGGAETVCHAALPLKEQREEQCGSVGLLAGHCPLSF